MARSSTSRSRLYTLLVRRFISSIWVVAGTLIAELTFAHASMAGGVLPQGGRYVAGAGTIAGDGNRIVVTQPGASRGVIDWRSFSIGKNNTVIFDNGAGATLNRVTGGSPSAILGNSPLRRHRPQASSSQLRIWDDFPQSGRRSRFNVPTCASALLEGNLRLVGRAQ
jgi:hypothetical protein